MNRKNKYNNTDQFIAQNLIEIEKPKNNVRLIVLIIMAIIMIIGGVSVYLYVNRDKFDWELRLPWQSPEEPPLIGGNKSKKEREQEKIDLVVPKFSVGESDIGDINIKALDLKHTDKGYEFTLNMQTKVPYSFKIDKILLDGFPFNVDLEIDSFVGNREETVKIAQTDLDRYNMIAFSQMNIFCYAKDLSSDKPEIFRSITPGIVQTVKYDNTVKGLIEVYNYGTSLLSYYRTETDKDNTYIYFHLKNSADIKKEITIKKLLINDELYEYEDFSYTVYNIAQDVFYLTIPKKKFKEVTKFSVSFFITEKHDNERDNAIYQTNDYVKEI